MSATKQDIENLQTNMINMGNNLQTNQINNFNNIESNLNNVQNQVTNNSNRALNTEIAPDRFTTPHLRGPYAVDVFEVGRKETLQGVMNYPNDVLYTGDRSTNDDLTTIPIKFDTIIAAQIYVPTNRNKNETYQVFTDKNAQEKEFALGDFDFDLILTSTFLTRNFVLSDELREDINNIVNDTTLTSEQRRELYNKIHSTPEIIGITKIKNHIKKHKSNANDMLNGLIKTTYTFDNISGDNLPVFIFNNGDVASATSEFTHFKYEQIASLGIVVIDLNLNQNFGNRTKIEDTRTMSQALIDGQYAKVNENFPFNFYVGKDTNGSIEWIESTFTRDYDILDNLYSGPGYLRPLIPPLNEDGSFNWDASKDNWVINTLAWSHYLSQPDKNLVMFEQSLFALKEMINETPLGNKINWNNCGVSGYSAGGDDVKASIIINNNDGKTQIYNPGYFLFKLNCCELGDPSAVSSPNLIDYVDKNWIGGDPTGNGYPCPTIISVMPGPNNYSLAWAHRGIQVTLRNTVPSILEECIIMYPSSNAHTDNLQNNETSPYPLLVYGTSQDGINYPSNILNNTSGVLTWGDNEPNVFETRIIQVLQMIKASCLFLQRNLVDKSKASLKMISNTGIPMDIAPYKVDGCENQFMGMNIGPYKMFWDKETDTIKTEKGKWPYLYYDYS